MEKKMMQSRTFKKSIETCENSNTTADSNQKNYSSIKSLETLTEAIFYTENLTPNSHDVGLQLICAELNQKNAKPDDTDDETCNNSDNKSEKSVDSELTYIRNYAAVDNLLYEVPTDPYITDDVAPSDQIELSISDKNSQYKAEHFATFSEHSLQKDLIEQGQHDANIEDQTVQLAEYMMKNKWIIFAQLVRFCTMKSLLQFLLLEGYNYDRLAPMQIDKIKSICQLKMQKSDKSLKQKVLKYTQNGGREILKFMLSTCFFLWILSMFFNEWIQSEVNTKLRMLPIYQNEIKRQLINVISCFNTMFFICTLGLNSALILPLWKRKPWHITILYLNLIWCFYFVGSFILTFLPAMYHLYKTGTAWDVLVFPILICTIPPLYHLKLGFNMIRIPLNIKTIV